MDAKERLRRYLEQRRELGESELVLDAMSVDDVMTLLGARATSSSARQARPPASAMVPPAPRAPNTGAPSADSPGQDLSAGQPVTSGDEPAPQPQGAAPQVEPPPLPPQRFDASATGDWREALRQAAAAGPSGAPQGAATPPTSKRASLPAWLAALEVTGGLSVEPIPATEPVLEVATAPTLDAVADLVRACTRCSLHRSARNAVPGEGNPQADLVCVGEAPGANEDEQGRPFVGEAGQLLTKILSAINLSRDEVYICNVLKHRPPGNRDPLPDEVLACGPFLQRQLDLLRPRVIIALGRFAAQTLLGSSLPLGQLREQIHLYRGIPVIVTYHPAALLRNDTWKRPTWNDVKLARRVLDAARAHGEDGVS